MHLILIWRRILTIIQQRVLPITGLSDDVGILESSIVYEALYLLFEAEEIVSLMARFLVEVAIFIEVPSKRYRVRHWYGI